MGKVIRFSRREPPKTDLQLAMEAWEEQFIKLCDNSPPAKPRLANSGEK